MNIDRQNIIQLRKELNWTQEDLAAASGLSARTIQRVERSGKASLDTTKALAIAFDVTVDALQVKSLIGDNMVSSQPHSKASRWASMVLLLTALILTIGFFFLLDVPSFVESLLTSSRFVELIMENLFSLLFIILWPIFFLVSAILFVRRRYQAAKTCIKLSAFSFIAPMLVNDLVEGTIPPEIMPLNIAATYTVIYVCIYACFEYFRRKDTMFESA